MNLFEKDDFDPSFPNSLSGWDEFQWQLTNLNAFFSSNFIAEKRIWITIWRNWTYDFNAVSFSGRNLIENKIERRSDENGRQNLYHYYYYYFGNLMVCQGGEKNS